MMFLLGWCELLGGTIANGFLYVNGYVDIFCYPGRDFVFRTGKTGKDFDIRLAISIFDIRLGVSSSRHVWNFDIRLGISSGVLP